MNLINTIWLWGLAGLLIPIGIHLLSRKAGKVIKFGSIRHLDDTNTKRFENIRLNEFLLLALRCLFIVFIVLLLCGIQISNVGRQNKWLLFEKGIDKDPLYSEFIDSLTKKGYKLKPLFAEFKDSKLRDSTSINYWNTLQSIGRKHEAIVVSYNFLKGFRGKRMELPSNIRWLSKEPEAKEYTLSAIKSHDDTVVVRSGRSDAFGMMHSTTKTTGASIDTLNIENADTLAIAIVLDPAFANDKDIIVAAIQAAEKISSRRVQIDIMQSTINRRMTDYSWIIWLSDKIPDSLETNSIVAEENSFAEAILIKKNSAPFARWQLTRQLNTEVALETNLAVHLTKVLFHNEDSTSHVMKFDQRTLPEELRWARTGSVVRADDASSTSRSADQYIALAALVVLFIERWLAFKRKL
jgi:hypothetical protein